MGKSSLPFAAASVTEPTRKRKAHILPGFCDWKKKSLCELCGQFFVSTAGMRKEEMVEALFEIDHAATFSHESRFSPLDCGQLLVICLKARVRFIREKEEPSDAFPSFLGLYNDLTFLNGVCSLGGSSRPSDRPER
eukprot:s238_g29.t1